MKKSILGLFLLAFLADAVFGTERELSKSRNPFDFGKADSDTGGERSDIGTSGNKPVSRLGMVVEAGGERLAYIDGNPYRVGDVVDGARITDITLKYVVLVSPKKVWRMYVEPFKEME